MYSDLGARPWALDHGTSAVAQEALAALPWARVAAGLKAIEDGGIGNPSEGRRVGHTWLRAPSLAPGAEEADAIRGAVREALRLASEVRAGTVRAAAGPFTRVVHIGIGGSALGPQLLVDAVGGGGLPVHVVDTIDPDGLQRVLLALGDALVTTLVLVVSKSGGTVETMGGLDVISGALVAAGCAPARHLVAVTMSGSSLHQRAGREGWLAVLPLWDWVGGRFAATSVAGLLPLALSGGDVPALLAGAAAMDAWGRERPGEDPASVLAALWWVGGRQHGRTHMALLPYADRLAHLARFAQQLVMESLGKPVVGGHEGIVVFGHKGSTDQHAILQHLQEGPDDTLTVLLQVLAGSHEGEVPAGVAAGDQLQAMLLGTRRALSSAGRSVVVLTVPRVDAYVVGGLVAWIERAVSTYALLAGLNAYDQPGVEGGKLASKAILKAREALLARLGAGAATAPTLGEGLDLDALELGWLLDRLVATGCVQSEGEGSGRRYVLGVAR